MNFLKLHVVEVVKEYQQVQNKKCIHIKFVEKSIGMCTHKMIFKL